MYCYEKVFRYITRDAFVEVILQFNDKIFNIFV